MQVSVEINNDINCQMTVGVPKDRIDTAIQKRLKDLASKTRINGFRPGKVPISVVKQRYGVQVRQEVMGEITEESFQDALEQESLRPVSAPEIEFLDNEEDNDEQISYRAKFELYPKLDISLEDISITEQTAEVADEDIQAMLDKLRKQRVSWNEVEREAQQEDQVNIDFAGTLADETEPFEGGTSESFDLVLGSKKLIEGFEEGLVGTKAGEQVELDLHFPEGYGSPELAGKQVRFSVTVNTVSEAELPELDAELIKSFGIDSGDMDDFNVDIRENMSRELEQALKQKLKKQVLDALVNNNEVTLPGSLIDSDAQRMADEMRSRIEAQGGSVDGLAFTADDFKSQAAERVKLGLLISEIIGENKMTADDEKVNEAIEELASTYEDPDNVVQWIRETPEQLRAVESTVLEDQVVSWILEQDGVTRETESVSFEEVMNKHEATA